MPELPVSSIRQRRSKKKTKEAQEFEKMRLANEQRLQRLSYEGVIELPREAVARICPHIPGLTPPPSFRSHDSGLQEFEVPNSQDVSHQCHSVEEVDPDLGLTPRETLGLHNRKKTVNSCYSF